VTVMGEAPTAAHAAACSPQVRHAAPRLGSYNSARCCIRVDRNSDLLIRSQLSAYPILVAHNQRNTFSAFSAQRGSEDKSPAFSSGVPMPNLFVEICRSFPTTTVLTIPTSQNPMLTGTSDLGSGRIVALEIEIPNMLVDLV
jgi:hypothetical protein